MQSLNHRIFIYIIANMCFWLYDVFLVMVELVDLKSNIVESHIAKLEAHVVDSTNFFFFSEIRNIKFEMI